MLTITNANFTRKSHLNAINFWRNSKDTDEKILSNVNISLKQGEILTILGKNGVGKTTLIKCLLRLLKFSSGTCLLENKNIYDYSFKDFFSRISYVPQAKSNIFNITVLEMVCLGLNLSIKIKPKEIHYQKSKAILKRLNLNHLENKRCCNLSGGELQMVLFARALIREPKILILDEPESNLDFANQKIIIDRLLMLKEHNCGIIINTHFPAYARILSDKVLLLFKTQKDGAYAKFGNKELLSKKHLDALYEVDLSFANL